MANKATVDVSKLDSLVSFVRSHNESTGEGCARGIMQYVGGFDPNVIAYAHDCGKLESRKGKGGGSWPAGFMPAPVTDNEPSTTQKAFDMLLAYSRGEHIDPQDARNIWNEREALNQKRRK